MVYLGTDNFAHGAALTSGYGERDARGIGRLAAATWAIGLVVGLIGLTSGHELLAGVALVMAIMSPWFGLAWVAHSQRADARCRERAAMAPADQIASYAGGWPAPPLLR